MGSNLHPLLIMNLERLLRMYNYKVQRESPLFHDHLTLSTGNVQGKQDYVDLLGIGWNCTIAIEFDSCKSLRYNSIEKLLQSDADVLIGIVKDGTLNYNKERILEVMNESGITDRKVLLIVMSEKSSEEVRWQGY